MEGNGNEAESFVPNLPNASPSKDSADSISRREARELERLNRLKGKLTELDFSDISVLRKGTADYIKGNVVRCIRGSKSQFDARSGYMAKMLPPLTVDCCQTFATLSAVLLSSFGVEQVLEECCTTSTVNYLLYISAWMHQLTAPSWPSRGPRPTMNDLNTSLDLEQHFPSKVRDAAFEIVFYNESARARTLLRDLCVVPRKRLRQADKSAPPCGYVIVSGDYTVSVFSVDHDHPPARAGSKGGGSYRQAWTLYVCDSHGTQPWSQGKASFTGVTFGIPADASMTSSDRAGGEVLSVEDGIDHFSIILFTLLEEHRKERQNTKVPYMTWTPITRIRSLFFSEPEMRSIVEKSWIPRVLAKKPVQQEVHRFGFKPMPCFWGNPKTKGNL